MTPQEFIAKWKRANLSERSACQQHFLDLCEVLGQPKPAAADPDGAFYTFERGVNKTAGGKGWADVWFRGHFGWEYKGKHKNLDAAYQQLLLYREDLENPPLLVVCDLDRFEIHTNFTGTAKRVYRFDLDGLAEADNLEVLRKLFTDPEALRPGQTTESITRQAAERFGLLADGMRVRGVEAHQAAHFLMKLMFCMFGEDIGLLPEKLFSRILVGCKSDPKRLSQRLRALFTAMATGGDFGADEIMHFDGGLFADAEVVELRPAEIEELIRINDYDWGNVEPSIFGTLFERTLDPAKRSQIGAHYTSRQDILTLLEPVVMAPLRREWAEVRAKCDKLWKKVARAPKRSTRPRKPSKAVRDFERTLLDFVGRLAEVKILDPACGSGNFLYVAINLLLDLEKEVIAYAAAHDVSLLPHVRPTQLAGIEINPYAQQLAQVVIWIGYLQWMHYNGFSPPRDPVLEPIETIKLMDAILDLSDPEHPKEPEWPKADFIVGNPPFLGNRLMSAHFSQDYINALSMAYEQRLGGRPDICCYWFEKARQEIERDDAVRAGLLATQGIRGGTNRKTLERIKASGNIFFAQSDRNWILDGATVHVSMVGFDSGRETSRQLDGKAVPSINANLTAGVDTTKARRLSGNSAIGFQGSIKRGPFDVAEDRALSLLLAGGNPHKKPNSDVIVPFVNGLDITRRNRCVWIIDFGPNTTRFNAAQYHTPFEYVKAHVLPERAKANQKKAREHWWLHWCPRPQMTAALANVRRYLATPRVAKHRLFAWLTSPSYADCQLIVFADETDLFFGLLHSRIHEIWARAQGTQLRERESGFRYTPTTCFETFPFPEPTDDQKAAISAAAKELDDLRSAWLNPPEWTREEVLEFPGSVGGPWDRYIDKETVVWMDEGEDLNEEGPHPQPLSRRRERGVGVVRYPRIVPRDEECAGKLKKRTLTNLYNQRPTWLDLAHRKLDQAVFDAYGWDPGISDEKLLANLLELNLQRAGED